MRLWYLIVVYLLAGSHAVVAESTKWKEFWYIQSYEIGIARQDSAFHKLSLMTLNNASIQVFCYKNTLRLVINFPPDVWPLSKNTRLRYAFDRQSIKELSVKKFRNIQIGVEITDVNTVLYFLRKFANSTRFQFEATSEKPHNAYIVVELNVGKPVNRFIQKCREVL